jgi:hypothetical protein
LCRFYPRQVSEASFLSLPYRLHTVCGDPQKTLPQLGEDSLCSGHLPLSQGDKKTCCVLPSKSCKPQANPERHQTN